RHHAAESAGGGARDGSPAADRRGRCGSHSPRRPRARGHRADAARRAGAGACGLRRHGAARRAALHDVPAALLPHLSSSPRGHRRRRGRRETESLSVTPISWYLALSAVLFAIGTVGVLTRRNLIVVFMAIELLLNAVNLSFVALARGLGSMDGQVIVFFV